MKTTALTMTLFLALGAAAGCSSSGSGDDDGDVAPEGARLTIVGERSLLMENGWATELTVRYSDDAGAPLAGQVEFALAGEAAGAYLSDGFAFTDAEGMATITLNTGEAGDATFRIEASAEAADPVTWDIQVLERALEVTGSYRVRSEFDLASGLPGAVGDVVNTFIEMTDDPYDPATWVLDQIVAEIDNGTVEGFINGARPGLDAILNELLIQNTPDIVGRLVEIGDAFGQIARKFGTTSTLEVTDTNDVDGNLAARHLLTELVFTIDGTSYPYGLADMGADVPAADASFSYDQLKYHLGDHAFPLSYGTILMVALEQIIIPLVDGGANDLAGLLDSLVDCQAVGAEIADFLGFGTTGLYAGACDLGLSAAAGWVEDQIRGLDDSAMVLGIAGSARWIDSNGDRKVDVLQGGTWTGDMTYIGTPAPLGESTFRGERMTAPQ